MISIGYFAESGAAPKKVRECRRVANTQRNVESKIKMSHINCCHFRK